MQAPPVHPWHFSWRGFAQLGRVSNLPTCVSNVLVGVALAPLMPDADTLLRILIVVTLLYYAGMALNDLVDVAHDQQHARHRPLIAGQIGFRFSAALTAGCFFLGIAAARTLGPAAFSSATLLLLAIVAYDLLHKHSPVLVVVMGACRGLVYALAALASGAELGNDAWLCIGSVSVYTALLTLVARGEHGEDATAPRVAAWLLPFSVLPLVWLSGYRWEDWWAVLPFLLWTLRGIRYATGPQPRVVGAILTWLSGISLLDLLILSLLGRYDLVLAAAVCFLVVFAAHRRILGS